MGSIDYEVELTQEERSVQEMVHRFAEEVLRPAGASSMRCRTRRR